MANYYLTVDKKRIIEFNKIPAYNYLSYRKLEDLVKFTSHFKEELELKETLLKYCLITPEEMTKPLKIIYNYNKNIKTLMYGPTYYDDIRFFDTGYIKYYLKSKRNDYVFLEKLCNHYRNSYLQGTNITIIRKYINYMKFEKEIDYELNEEFDETINSFVRLEIYSYDKKTNAPKLKYKNLRDLAMFLAYDKRKQEKAINVIENKKIEEIPKKVKVKKKTKEIKGQMTFEDMGWL